MISVFGAEVRKQVKHLPPHEENKRSRRAGQGLSSEPKPAAGQMDCSLGLSHFLEGARLTCDLHHGQYCTWPIHSLPCQGAPPTHRDGELGSYFWKAHAYLIRQLLINRYLETSGQDSRCYRPTQRLRRGTLVGSTEPWSPACFTPSRRSCSIHVATMLNQPSVIYRDRVT